jgi:ketosteroid isomerase-like protein
MNEPLTCLTGTLKQLALAAAILTTNTVSTVMAQPNTVPSSSQRAPALETANKAAVQTALDGWMKGNGNALQALLSDDVEWTIAGNSAASGTTRGRTELMKKVLEPFGARFSRSDDRFRPRLIRGIYADGDNVIVHFDGAGTTNDGEQYKNSYVWILTLRDQKVIRGTAFFDSIAFDAMWHRVAPAER